MKPKKPIYLDHAAATPIDSRVLEAMQPYLTTEFYNPSSIYLAAKQDRLAHEAARAKVADILGAKTTEIVFTAGATESINLALQGVAKNFPVKHIVTTNIEHAAVLETLHSLQQWGYQVTYVPVKPNGIVDAEAVIKAVTPETVLVSVMYANNEIGTIQPIPKIAQGLAKLRQGRELPLYFHTDAAQAGEYLDLHVSRLGVDLLSLNGSKIYGPKQSGALYVKTGVQLQPVIYGGGQERGRRSGTENVAGAVGFATALAIAQKGRAEEGRRLESMRDDLIAKSLKAIGDAKLNASQDNRLPNNINLTIPRVEGEALVLYLDQVGVMASTGSACSSGDLDPSHVLLALGLDSADANCSLRLTLGRSTTQADLDYVVTVLPTIAKRLRQL